LLNGGTAEIKSSPPRRLELPYSTREGSAYLAIVSEKTHITDNRVGRTNVLQAQVLGVQYRGGEYRLRVRIGDSETGQILEARSNEYPRGDWLFLHLPSEALHVIQLGTAPAPKRSVTNMDPRNLQEEMA
jgi:hypothetical protein